MKRLLPCGRPILKQAKCTEDTMKGKVFSRSLTNTVVGSKKFIQIDPQDLFKPTLQRYTDKGLIKQISKRFDETLLNVLVFPQREPCGGVSFWTIDGQHCALGFAAHCKNMGLSAQKITAELADFDADPFSLFKERNKKRKNVTPDDLMWNDYEGDDPDTVWFFNYMKDTYDIELRRLSEASSKMKDPLFTGGHSIFKHLSNLENTCGDKDLAKERLCLLIEASFDAFQEGIFYTSAAMLGKTRQAIPDCWAALKQFMDEQGWTISSEDMAARLDIGAYAINNIGRSKRLATPFHYAAETEALPGGTSAGTRVKNLVSVIDIVNQRGITEINQRNKKARRAKQAQLFAS